MITFQDFDVCEAASHAHHGLHGAGRVVVGVDGSPSSLAALRWAHGYAWRTGSGVQAVTVYAPMSMLAFGVFAYPTVPPVDPERVRRAAEDDLEHAVTSTFGGDSTEVSRLLVQDNSPGRALLRAARDAALLVVGATHRHGIGVLLGSTAAACIRDATVPVVVVPDRELRVG